MPKEPKCYFVIYVSEDGDVSINQMTMRELVDRLNAEPGDNLGRVITDLGEDMELCNINGSIIIKGEIVRPRAAKVVETWEV